MNERIRELVKRAGGHFSTRNLMSNPVQHIDSVELWDDRIERFAKLLIEDVLNEVKERAYYTGDRDWSDEVDRPWIQLEFGYGSLQEMKNDK